MVDLLHQEHYNHLCYYFENQKHLEIFIDELITYGETKTQIILSNVVAHHPIDKI